ncbi:MAG: diguanylate cyclase domain-containing protein, partial [Chroococcales cyanobacterium]
MSVLKKWFEPEQLLQRITHQIQQSDDLIQILGTTVSEIRAFLEVDRVKVYQFAADGSGKVVAESRSGEQLPSLLGLNFPATDIPPRVRERFLKGKQRVIVDVTSKRKTLSPLNGGKNGHYFSLKESEYSSVDPCHLQYLLGMGVLASLTVPIFHQTQLWGLLAIHHGNPHQFGEQELQIIELLVNQISIAIAQSTLMGQAQQQVQHEAILKRLNARLEHSLDSEPQWQNLLTDTVEALQGCGGRLYIIPEPTEKVQELYTWGEQPSHAYLEKDSTWQEFIGIANLVKPQDSTIQPTANSWEEFGEALILGLGHPSSLGYHSSGLPIGYTLLDFYRIQRFKPLIDLFEPTPIRSILLIPLQYRQQWVGYIAIFAKNDETETLWAGEVTGKEYSSQPRPSFEPWCELKQQAHEWNLAERQLAQQIGLNLYMAVMRQRVRLMLEHQTSHDSLTHLPNRIFFNEQLSLALAKARHQGTMVGVIVLDLDRFTTINDSLGYDGGDSLLKSVAKRLQEQLTQGKETIDLPLVARWHGDEFTILLPQLDSAEQITGISQEIVNSFHLPFYVSEQELYLTASIGSALAPYDGEDAETLLKNAEAAMYCAKQQGKNTYQIYSPTIGNRDFARLELEVNLRKALARDELFLHFQPQVDLRTG